MTTIIIAFFSLVFLAILHELGHFLLAKKFGVKVEEFGIGYPPRLIGKKVGETIYSLNLLPFGAFVKMPGEIGKSEDPRSFSQQSVWKRVLIALGGVFSFWIIALTIFSIVFTVGAPISVGDEDNSDLINPELRIAAVVAGSPAEDAGLRIGDMIKKISVSDNQLTSIKVKEFQNFVNFYSGKKVDLLIERGEEVFETSLVPRVSPPAGEGPMGIALVRTAIQKYPWYSAIWQGILTTGRFTLAIIQSYGDAIGNIFRRMPTGIQLVGPVGVFQMLTQTQQLGVVYFLNFLALISIHLAIFNSLPIPAVDGGRVLFLAIEALRKKPVSEKVEVNMTVFSFAILIILMIFVTVKDILRIF